MKAIELLEYILFRLPIYNLEYLSLEDIAKEFKLYDKYKPESTQEEIAEFLLQNFRKGGENG